jgi:hypothetical protein
MPFIFWDFILLFAVTTLVIITAYVENPQRKAFILMIPIPFSIAVLSLGQPIDATNVIALLLLNLYYHIVRVLHYRLGAAIVISIGAGAVIYCILGGLLAAVIPETPFIFWISCAAVFGVSLVLYRIIPVKQEPGNRTNLPLYTKIPLTAAMVIAVILLKRHLQGFMTFFPMVGVFATYETRKSLWTNCKKIPVLSMIMVPMLITIRIFQSLFSLQVAVLFGWITLLALLIPYFHRMQRSLRPADLEVKGKPS